MDTRTPPANSRVAANELRGMVQTDQFVQGEDRRIAVPVADLRCRQGATQLDRQLLMGDRFRALEVLDGLAFGQADRGDYVGYVPADCLGPWHENTHWVSVRASLVFDVPDFKHPNPRQISYGSRVSVAKTSGRFSALAEGGFVPSAHLTSLDSPATDPVSEAEKFLGAPYLWGGNASFGLDCSGLVQAALLACSVPCPGDSDLQLNAFEDATGGYQRGDLLFWKGHVAMVVSTTTLIHANAFHMAVSYEGIQDAITRIAEQGDGPVTGHKRPVLPE